MNIKDVYQSLLNKIEDLQPNYYGFEQVVYSVMDLLQERENFNLNEIANWLKEILNHYSEHDVIERIDNKIDEVIKEHPEKEQDFYSEAFILGELSENDYNRDLDKCCEYLGELNPSEWIEWYQWLEDWIKEKNLKDNLIQAPTLPNAKPYELMAILALSYVKDAIDFNDADLQIADYKEYSILKKINLNEFLYLRQARAVREIINAYNSINKAQEWKFNIEFKNKENDIIKKP